MDYLSKKNFDVWLTRLNMPKSLRLLDPVLDSDKNCETAWSIKGYENSVNGGYEPSIKGGYYPSVTMNGETRSLSEHSKKFAFIDDFASMLSLN